MTRKLPWSDFVSAMLRIIYSLSLDIIDPIAGWTGQLIAPLSRSGSSPHCRPEPPKQRAIDLRVGDYLRHGKRRYRVDSILAYREALVGDDYAERRDATADGYLLRVSDRPPPEQR